MNFLVFFIFSASTTVSVLKNFASINSNMVFKAGNTVKTMAESKTIMASSNIITILWIYPRMYDILILLGENSRV